MFIYNSLLVGPLLPGQSTTLEFPYVGITILKLHPSCGCSDTFDDKEKQKVRVKYTAQEIPPQAMGLPQITTEKFIEVVYYIDDPNVVQRLQLSFKATVLNRKR